MPVPNLITDCDTNAANNSPPGTESAKGNIDNYLRAAFAFIRQLYNTKAANGANADITSLTGLTTALSVAQGGTGSTTPAAARTALGIGTNPQVRNLKGNVNATTPLTKFDLSCDFVTLRDANGATATLYGPHSRTVDLGLAGAVVNGRDQVAAFASNSWVHLYWIWDGTTLGLIASLSATAPTLPTGYTHWSYATTIRWNASSSIIPAYIRGSEVAYDIADGGANRVLSAGVATSVTSISCSSLIPPNALRGRFGFTLFLTNASINTYNLFVRPTGSTQSGQNVCRASVQAAGGADQKTNWTDYIVGASQQIDYYISAAPSSGGAYIDVIGFKVPNGDA